MMMVVVLVGSAGSTVTANGVLSDWRSKVRTVLEADGV